MPKKKSPLANLTVDQARKIAIINTKEDIVALSLELHEPLRVMRELNKSTGQFWTPDADDLKERLIEWDTAISYYRDELLAK